MTKHIPVFKDSSIEFLNIKPDGVYVDCTFGGGGHSLEILKKLRKGKLIALDSDSKAIEAFDSKEKNLILVNANFADLDSVLKSQSIEKVDGILVDLGWSTDQLNRLEGLSFQNTEDLLDMRIDSSAGVTAADLLNVMNKKQLHKVFEIYGDLNFKEAGLLANQIIKSRRDSQILKVKDLNSIVHKIRLDSNPKNLARIYQSLRIAVNNEYQNLKILLNLSLELLNPDGVFVAITFHSGEHRILKEFIRENREEKIASLIDKYASFNLEPSVEEVARNYSARSAKLWAFKKL